MWMVGHVIHRRRQIRNMNSSPLGFDLNCMIGVSGPFCLFASIDWGFEDLFGRGISKGYLLRQFGLGFYKGTLGFYIREGVVRVTGLS